MRFGSPALRRWPPRTRCRPAAGPSAKTAAKPPPGPNNCLECHGNGDVWEGERLRLYVTEQKLAGDIHWQKGLRCADCHGGNPEAEEVNQAHAEEDGFHNLRATPKDFNKPPDPAKVVELCGKCHANIEYMRRYRPSPRTDQLAEYLDQRPRQGAKGHRRHQGGHLHRLPRQAPRIRPRQEQTRHSGHRRSASRPSIARTWPRPARNAMRMRR